MSWKRTASRIIGRLLGPGFIIAGLVLIVLRPALSLDPATCGGPPAVAACYQLAFFMNLPTPWDWLLASIFLISSGYAVIWATRRGLLFAGDAGFSRYMADEAREWGMDNPETMGVELAGVSAPERWLYWKLTGAERVTPDIVERGQKRGLLLFTAIASLITLLFIITMALNA